ncbi:cupin domain-containing protein [Streptomyces bambusae]|uniref:cupin domain-containing protein n=1 Tax=Streptomyces bambusae TaxID=1550616 RepID=UPI001CFD0EB8|nr:cupin domain-containing protein [Streptomyces bambusae]MCB5164704.1 cupin domain-containing protein [Streptomyces bambusae]
MPATHTRPLPRHPGTSFAPAPDTAAAEYGTGAFVPVARQLARGTAQEPIELHVEGVSEVLMRRIVLPVGGTTGWHWHPGDLLAVVEQGELTHTDGHGRTHRYGPGDAFLEPRGSRHVHEGRNTGGHEVVLHVTYLNPGAGPLAVPVG